MNSVRPRSFKEFCRVYGKAFLHEQGAMPDKTYQQLQGCRSVVENFIKDRAITVDIFDPTYEKGKEIVPTYLDEVVVRIEHLCSGNVHEESFFNLRGREPIARQIYQYVSEIVGTSSKDKKPIDDFVSNSRWRFFNYLARKKEAIKNSEIQQENTIVNNA